MAELKVIHGIDAGRRWTLSDERPVVIGREPGCSIVLADRRVSRQHCRIEYRDGGHVLTNLSRTNGTLIGGVRVAEQRLDHNDEVYLGETVLRFLQDNEATEPDVPAVKPAGGGVGEQSVILHSDDIASLSRQTIDVNLDAPVSAPEGLSDADRVAEEVKSYSRRFQIIRAVGDSVVSELDLDRLFELILDHVFNFVQAERGCVLTYDEASGECVPSAVRARDPRHLDEGFHMSRSVINHAFQERVAILSTDALADDRFSAEASIIMQGIRSVMCAPMLFHDEPLGLIAVDNRDLADAFSRQDLETLSIIANLAATAIHNARMVSERVEMETSRRNFARFLPPELVQRVTEAGGKLSLGGETATVTVLFADIRDFTPMCEAKRPKEVVDILNTYYGRLTECVFQNGGTLDKYIGDAIMAVFGSPEPYPDHTVRAARCALDMCGVLESDPLLRAEIQAGVSLHRGEAIHGYLGSEEHMQYTVIGDTVNTAARLNKVAKGNHVVVSKSCVDAEPERLKTVRLPAVRVQGKTEPLECYQLTGVD